MEDQQVKKSIIAALKRLAGRQIDRARIVGVTPRRIRQIEAGDVPPQWVRLVKAGVVQVNEDQNDAN